MGFLIRDAVNNWKPRVEVDLRDIVWQKERSESLKMEGQVQRDECDASHGVLAKKSFSHNEVNCI